MTKILLLAILTGTVGAAVFSPWIGVMAYFTQAIMIPNLLWPWVFQGVKASYLTGAATIIGTLVALVTRRVFLHRLLAWQNVFIVTLWLSLLLSYYYGAYGRVYGYQIQFNSLDLITHYHKMFLMYFMGVLCVDSAKKLHFLVVVFLCIIVYYIYWGNHQYLAGLWSGYRLDGPGGIYSDENTFAVLFVTGIPFLFFMGQYYKHLILRYFLWGLIPLAWHVIFLTGSLGAMIGLVASTLAMIFKGSNKKLKILIPVFLALAFVYQGGAYLKAKVGLGTQDITQIATAKSRIDSWKAGLKMLADHPLTGVGLGQFIFAYRDYSDADALVAHNTFLQYASQSGLAAGLMYLMIIYGVLHSYLREIFARQRPTDDFLSAVRDATAIAVIGFFVCSMFLNLGIYEIFYFILLLGFAERKVHGPKNQEGIDEYPVPQS
jgi:O-antigen ligase